MKILEDPGLLFDTAAACSLSVMSPEQRQDPRALFRLPDLPAEGMSGEDPLSALPDLVGQCSPAALPFFRGNGDGLSPAGAYILSLPPEIGAEDALRHLRGDGAESARLRSCLTETLFCLNRAFRSGDALPSDPAGGMTAEEAMLLRESELPVPVRLETALCLARFGDAVDGFCAVMERALPLLRRLRILYAPRIRDLAEAVLSGQYDALYREAAGFRPEELRFVSISLLAPDLCEVSDGERLLLCGIRHHELLLERFEDAHISAERFFDDIGSGPRRRILEILSRGGERTASALSRETGLPVTTTLRHLEVLSNDLLIQESRRSGLKIYYALNARFLVRASEKAERYLSALTGEHGKRNAEKTD